VELVWCSWQPTLPNSCRGTPAFGRVVALGGDSPISLPYEKVYTVSNTAGNGAQKRFARFPPTYSSFYFRLPLRGYSAFAPAAIFTLFCFHTVRSRLETGHSQLIPMARAGFLKIQSYLFGPRVYSGSTQFYFF